MFLRCWSRVLDAETKDRLQKMSNLEIIKEMARKISETDEFLEFCKALLLKSPEFEKLAKEHGKELKWQFTLK